jgi:phage terminase large subunit GpA-like protein
MSENFVKTRLDPMIERTAAVRSKLQPVANANNIWLKLFRGMSLASIWPVPAQFAQRPIRFGWIDDYDQIDDDIGASGGEGGQGSAISLLEGRFTSHEGREKKFISSSPADERGGKTEAFVAGGTDERMQPVCPHCGDRFEIDILRDLRFDQTGTADQAEGSAHVVCAANGCLLEPADRRKVLASLTALPNRGFVAANALVSQRRRTFRIDGLMALTSWPKLARLWREAQIEWEVRQDESLLRTFVNTKGGKNYRSQASGEKPLDTEALKERREVGLFLGRIPAGVKAWVIVIDVQHNRLECMAYGWGEDLEGWIIDRWSIDVLDDGLTAPAPFTHPEHSSILLPLFSKRYPLADGSGLSPPPLTVQIDVGGGGIKGEGATGFVRTFWEAAVALGIHRSRITLTKGGSRPTADLMPRAKFADQKRRGGAKRTSAELWMPNVHRIKGMIDARLRRTDAGPGFIHLPGGKVGGGVLRASIVEGGTGRLLDEHIEEITAEELQKGRWVKVRPRNETLDLLVAAQAAILRPPFAQTRTHMRWVPAAFRVPEQGLPSAVLEEEQSAPMELATKTPKRRDSPAAKPSKFAPRGGSWINRRR